jgi:hypothetical protein
MRPRSRFAIQNAGIEMPLSETIFLGENGRIIGDIAREIALHEQIASDLRFLAEGHYPSESCLEAAPVIDNWRLSAVSKVALSGNIDGQHDDSRPADWVKLTDPLVAIHLGVWVRTETQLLRLGNAAPIFGRPL